MIFAEAVCQENLTGTNGEPALHTEPVKVAVVTTPFKNTFTDQVIEVFITSESLILYCDATTTQLKVNYPHITLHAVSSDPHALYLQIDDDGIGHELLSKDSDYAGGMLEVFLTPKSQDPQDVNKMFAALSTCASMHPDPANGDKELDDSMMSFEQQMNDPNHKWFTADDLTGQFNDAEDQQEDHNGHTDEVDSEDAPRKWRKTS